MSILHLVMLVVLLVAALSIPGALIWVTWHISRDRAEIRKYIEDLDRSQE